MRITLGVVLAACSLVPAAVAGAGAAASPPALDPDAAAGLDDARWTPPPGAVRIATLPSGLPAVPVGAPGGVTAQAVDETRFGWQGRNTHLFTYCVYPSRTDARIVDMKGCFTARRFDEERDQSGNHYVGEGFRVFARGKEKHRLQRVKGRAEQRAGEAVDWAPGAGADYGNPATVGVTAGWNGSGLSASWNLYPGRIHPWVGRQVFHSSWITKARGAPADERIQSVGAAVWQFAPGRSALRSGRAEVWLRR